MAYTQAQLEALKNSLLASNQPDKITATKHRQFEQAIINEMFDAQSRANLLTLIQSALTVTGQDKVIIVTNGQTRQVSAETFLGNVQSINRVYKGRFTNPANLLIAYPNDDPDALAGDYAQVGTTNTYWERDVDTLEWYDTGDIIQSIEIDAFPTLGSGNVPSSNGVKLEIDSKAPIIHSHTITDISGLDSELSEKLYIDDFLATLVANTEQGSNVTLTIVGGKLRISSTGGGGGASNFVDIGGEPLDNTALATEFAKYVKKSSWFPVTPVSSVLTLPAQTGYNDFFSYTESGNITLALSGTYQDTASIWLRTTLAGTSHTITLPSGFVDSEGAALPSFIITGTAGKKYDSWFVKEGSNWISYPYVEVTGSGGTYDLESPTTTTVGLMPSGSAITGLTWQEIIQWITTGIGPIVGSGFFDSYFDNFFN